MTVSVAVALVALPVELETTAEKVDPLFAVVVAGVVKLVPVAPLMAAPFCCH